MAVNYFPSPEVLLYEYYWPDQEPDISGKPESFREPDQTAIRRQWPKSGTAVRPEAGGAACSHLSGKKHESGLPEFRHQ